MGGKVVLVRHGATSYNAGGESAERIRGWVDHPLNKEGKEEATRLAEEFKNVPLHVIYTSPLCRASHTAGTIAAAHTVPVEVHEDVCLYPWMLGHLQGELVSVALPVMNKFVDHDQACPPGGEPFSVFRRRFLDFLYRKICAADRLDDGSAVMLVTHSRGIQVTKAWQAAGFPSSLAIDTSTMLNYEQETTTGGHMWISVNDIKY